MVPEAVPLRQRAHRALRHLPQADLPQPMRNSHGQRPAGAHSARGAHRRRAAPAHARRAHQRPRQLAPPALARPDVGLQRVALLRVLRRRPAPLLRAPLAIPVRLQPGHLRNGVRPARHTPRHRPHLGLQPRRDAMRGPGRRRRVPAAPGRGRRRDGRRLPSSPAAMASGPTSACSTCCSTWAPRPSSGSSDRTW